MTLDAGTKLGHYEITAAMRGHSLGTTYLGCCQKVTWCLYTEVVGNQFEQAKIIAQSRRN